MIPISLPPLFVCVVVPALIEEDMIWKTLVDAYICTLRARRGMKGYIVYRPGISSYSPKVLRVYQLTEPLDYDILLENAVVSPCIQQTSQLCSTTKPIAILPWDPEEPLSPESGIWNLNLDLLASISAWRYNVSRDLLKLSNIAQSDASSCLSPILPVLNSIHLLPGTSFKLGLLKVSQTHLAQALKNTKHRPLYFPENFIPTGLAIHDSQGWISCTRAITHRYLPDDETKIVWDAESIIGRNCGWAPCPHPTPDELTVLPPYDAVSNTPRIYLRGFSFGERVYREFVEVHPSEVIDKDPIQRFWVGSHTT